MRTHLKFLAALMLFAGSFLTEALAGNVEFVDWPTYYPSPYGNYRRLVVTETASLGTANNSVVTLATGGGAVGIGLTAPASPLHVRSNNASYPAAFAASAAGFGIQIGTSNGVTYGAVQGYQNTVSPTGPLNLIAADVIIGATATPNFDLTLGTGVTWEFRRGGNTGTYKVAKGTDGNYYAAYAPG